MGIRFTCPNGHKLNVKSFLAGKKGICPHCGVKLDIPQDSQIDVAGDTSPEGIAASVAPAETETTASAAAPTATMAIPPEPSSENQPPAVGTVSDPISESPEAIWYVRPSSGGQYGPASGEVMCKWIDEGRVANDSLVWRQGWPDWKPAEDLFPSLAPPEDPNEISEPLPWISQLPAGEIPDSVADVRIERPRVGKRKSRNIGLIAGLVLVTAILLVCLIFVLVNSTT